LVDKIEIGDGFLRRFIDETKNMTPLERGKHLQEVYPISIYLSI